MRYQKKSFYRLDATYRKKCERFKPASPSTENQFETTNDDN